MTLIAMMRSLSLIRATADRWPLSAVRSDKCGDEIELILGVVIEMQFMRAAMQRTAEYGIRQSI